MVSSHSILKFFEQLQVIISEESFHGISSMSFAITLARPASMFNEKAILSLFSGLFSLLVKFTCIHLTINSIFDAFWSVIIYDPWLLRLTVILWLQVTPNLHTICKLTCYQEIIQIWSLSFMMEMERFVWLSYILLSVVVLVKL